MWFVSVRVLNIFGVSVLVAISNPIPSKTFEVILFACTAVSDGRIKITLETVIEFCITIDIRVAMFYLKLLCPRPLGDDAV